MEEKALREREMAWIACPACEKKSYKEGYEIAKEGGHVHDRCVDMHAALPGFQQMTVFATLIKRCPEHSEAANG